MEEIPSLVGFLRQNLLPRRSFVEGKCGVNRLQAESRAASTLGTGRAETEWAVRERLASEMDGRFEVGCA